MRTPRSADRCLLRAPPIGLEHLVNEATLLLPYASFYFSLYLGRRPAMAAPLYNDPYAGAMDDLPEYPLSSNDGGVRAAPRRFFGRGGAQDGEEDAAPLIKAGRREGEPIPLDIDGFAYEVRPLDGRRPPSATRGDPGDPTAAARPSPSRRRRLP